MGVVTLESSLEVLSWKVSLFKLRLLIKESLELHPFMTMIEDKLFDLVVADLQNQEKEVRVIIDGIFEEQKTQRNQFEQSLASCRSNSKRS